MRKRLGGVFYADFFLEKITDKGCLCLSCLNSHIFLIPELRRAYKLNYNLYLIFSDIIDKQSLFLER